MVHIIGVVVSVFVVVAMVVTGISDVIVVDE